MAYSVFKIAEYFLMRSVPSTDWSITHLKLQKLVYYAQAWHLLLSLRREPLFNEEIEAWVHGPVCPDLYYKFRSFGFEEIPKPVNCNSKFSADTEEVLDAVWQVYGSETGKYLEQLTHEDLPWINARKNLGDWDYSNNIITLESMRDYYSKVLGDK